MRCRRWATVCRHRSETHGTQSRPFYKIPPLTLRISPVRYLESEEARYTAVGEISSGRPIRPRGDCASTDLRKSPSTIPAACSPSVSIIPGLMEFTRILREPNSLANTAVIASTDAFAAEYVAAFGGSRVLATEPMLMTL